MTNAKLNYLVGNGNACVSFLDAMAFEVPDLASRNKILNHGLSVRSLIIELKEAERKNRELEDRLASCSKELRLILSKEIDPIVEERFADLKAGLISYIEDYE